MGRGFWATVGAGLASACALAFGAGAAPAAAAPVTVFAAASLKNSVDDVDAAFRARTGLQVRASYGASSALARQIEAGAPADVFVSADVDWMDQAEKAGAIQTATRRDLLANRLALIAPKGSSVELKIAPGFPLLKALGTGRLALAGAQVPAGIYARDALTRLGVWSAVEGRVVYGADVRSALAFVDHGEAPLGIVYATDAGIDPGVRVVGLFPADTHPPIIYPAALVKGSTSPDAARYLAFLEGPEAAAIFRRYGFTVLGR